MSKHSATGAKWQAQRQRVLNRDGWQCCLCGKALAGTDATVDHIEAAAATGRKATDYADEELMALCRACNGRKQDKPLIRLGYRNPRWFNN